MSSWWWSISKASSNLMSNFWSMCRLCPLFFARRFKATNSFDFLFISSSLPLYQFLRSASWQMIGKKKMLSLGKPRLCSSSRDGSIRDFVLRLWGYKRKHLQSNLLDKPLTSRGYTLLFLREVGTIYPPTSSSSPPTSLSKLSEVAWKFWTPILFPVGKQSRLDWGLYDAEKSTYLNEPNVRKPLLGSSLQRSEDLRLYNTWFSTVFGNCKPSLESGIFKWISWMKGSFLGMIGDIWKRKSRSI
jgi:hypothetical protein